MILKSFWVGTSNWLRTHTPFEVIDHHPDIDNEGLLCTQPGQCADYMQDAPDPQHDQAIVKAINASEKREPLEKLQDGFNQLIKQLEGINAHLGQQVSQHETLVGHVEQLPEVLNSIPDLIQNQKQATEDLYEMMRETVAKDEQFMTSVERIPEEAARQTKALRKLDERLDASAGLDSQLMEGLGQFNETLAQLHTTAQGQTDYMGRMAKAITDRDCHFRQMMFQQNRRFAWVFFAVVGLSVSCAALVAGVVFYLR
jgi:DNA repair ATPase RecN